MNSASPEEQDPVEQLSRAVQADDPARVRGLLVDHPELKARINEPLGPFDSPPIVNARSREMLDVLLRAGADLNARSTLVGRWLRTLGLGEPRTGRLRDRAGCDRGRAFGRASGHDRPPGRVDLAPS